MIRRITNTLKYTRGFIFEQKCIPWKVREFWGRKAKECLELEHIEEWSIGIYRMSLDNGTLKLTDLAKNPVLTAKHIKDRNAQYAADPFIVFKNGGYFMFFEILKTSPDNRKGVIGLAVSKNGKEWKFKKTVLEEPFHLSYPNVFIRDGKYYMLPECNESKSVRLYEAVNFPEEWRLVKTLLEGRNFVDPTVFSHEGKFWMFLSDTSNCTLYLYYSDSLEGEWKEHPKSPIIKNDFSMARPAGNVLSIENRLIRITQDYFKSYGYAVRAFEITKLSTEEYEEKELPESPLLKASGKGWNKDGMHHLSVLPIAGKEWIASVDGKAVYERYKSLKYCSGPLDRFLAKFILNICRNETLNRIRGFIFEQKCIPWRIIESWNNGGIHDKVMYFLRQLIIWPAWLSFSLKRNSRGKTNWRIGFLGDQFEHLDLMPFGGHAMTLKFVTDYLNNNNDKPLKADVLMTERRDVPAVTVKRYHSADLIFLPRRASSPSVYFQCSRLLNQRGINVFIGVEHFVSYEYYLKNFPYMPWVIWIKAPKDRQIFEKILTVTLEAKIWKSDIDGLVRHGEKDAESLRRMIRIGRSYGRKIYFGAEANFLAEIARRKYGLDDINAFHWPNPIPLPDIAKATFSEKPSFLLLGRLDPIKRPWIFFELAKRFKDADFYVAGATHHPEVMNPVIAKYKDVPNLKFTGRIEGKDKAELLDRAWAVVNTSVQEGVPVSLLEGFSYGKPAVAALDPDGLTSRFGIYVGEVYGDGDDAGSLDRFSSAIERMINGSFDKERIGQQARQYIASVHSFSYFESALLRVLNSPTNFQYKVY